MPRLFPRTDTRFVDRGVATALNTLVLKQGGIVKRGGLEYVGDCYSHSTKSRLIDYDFGLDQAYAIELANLAIRFVRDGGIVGAPTVVVSTYAEASLFDIGYASSGDVTYLAHRSHAPALLTRLSDTSWTLADQTFSPSISAPTISGISRIAKASATASESAVYAVTAVTDDGEESVRSSASTAPATPAGAGALNRVSWGAVAGAVEYYVYKRTLGSTFGYIGFTTATSIDDEGFAPDTSRTPPTARNPFNGANNYPEAVTLHQQRLCYASTNNKPELVEMSKPGALNNFSESASALATDSISLTVLGRTVNRIRHLIDMKTLLALSTGGVHSIEGTDDSVLEPGKTKTNSEGKYGLAAVRPVVDDKTLIVVMRDGKTVRDLAYNFSEDGYVGAELTAASEHLFESATIVDMAFQRAPDRVLWCVLSDGGCAALTYMREHEVVGWTRIETAGEFESVCVIPEGSYDQPYFTIKRTINGQTRRFIERLRERDTTASDRPFHVDAGLTYAGSAASVIGGLSHLIGETVVALADGDVVRDLVVSGAGEITLPFEASRVHVGLPYEARVRTVPYAPDTQDQGATGAIEKNVSRVSFRLHRTLSLKAAQVIQGAVGSFTELAPLVSNDWDEALPTPTSGVVRMDLTGEFEDDGQVEFWSDDPLPMEVHALYLDAVISE